MNKVERKSHKVDMCNGSVVVKNILYESEEQEI